MLGEDWDCEMRQGTQEPLGLCLSPLLRFLPQAENPGPTVLGSHSFSHQKEINFLTSVSGMGQMSITTAKGMGPRLAQLWSGAHPCRLSHGQGWLQGPVRPWDPLLFSCGKEWGGGGAGARKGGGNWADSNPHLQMRTLRLLEQKELA